MNLTEAQKAAENFHKGTFNGAFKHISFWTKITNAKTELLATDPTKVIKWGWAIWDKIFWWIYGWKVYVIGWESWNWKSTFINQLAMSLASQDIKVTKYALEDRMEDIWKEDLFSFTNRILKAHGRDQWNFPDFMNNEYTHVSWRYYDPNNISYINKAQKIISEKFNTITELEKQRMVSIDDLIKLIEIEVTTWTKVFMIDHLHYFQKKDGGNRNDLEIENTMHKINEISRKHNVAIFLVAHYRKLNNSFPTNDSFKDASAIKQVANVIIHIVREDWLTKFIFWKIRWKIWCKWFLCHYNILDDTYSWFSHIED
jgi:archaellum biogenesis ATPase FlaH